MRSDAPRLPALSGPRISRRAVLRSAAVMAIAPVIKGCSSLGETASTPPKRIYLAPDDHTDYFWSADGETYRHAFVDMLDYYLALADTTDGEPSGHQSRWNCDGSFWFWVYERSKPESDFLRLIERVRDGHISLPLNALVVCYGGAPAEAILRGFYYAGRLERRHGLRIPVAVAMENQTLPYGIGALWAGCGARYSWKGICGCATRINARMREHDIYWMEGPDGSRILMKWNSMPGSNTAIGGYAETRDAWTVIDYVDTDPGFQARYPYQVIGAFGQGWDDLKTLNDHVLRAAKEKTTARRQVIVSNQLDYFEDFEKTYGDRIPSQACGFGNEWDLYSASMSEVSARVRRAVEALRGAEAMATVVSLHQPAFMAPLHELRDQAFMALGLFWEHNWTADGPVAPGVRADWQRELAGQIERYVDTLHAAATKALGRMIRRQGARPRFFVFNPLGWTRSDTADLPYDGRLPVHVIDLRTGEETPSQIVTVHGRQCLRVLARSIPPAGYAVFEIRPGAGTAFPAAATVSADGTRIETDLYSVTLAPNGAVTSLIDRRQGNRQFIRQIGGRFANDLGPNTGPSTDPGAGGLSVIEAGCVSVTLEAEAEGPLPHTTRLTLTRDSRRIALDNTITRNFGGTFSWGFGFAIEAPVVHHEEVGAIVRARLLADGGHYAPRNARYDWLTLNHFADISPQSGGAGITLSNADCAFFRLGNSSPTWLDTTTPQISALAGGQVDGPHLGIPEQGGDTQFHQRFALTTHKGYEPTQAMRFALEHQNPLIAAMVEGGSALPETSCALLRLSDPRALLWALKPADDGVADAGIIARLWNVSDAPVSATLTLNEGSIIAARETTHIETNRSPAPVAGGTLPISLAPRQMRTWGLTVDAPRVAEGPAAG